MITRIEVFPVDDKPTSDPRGGALKKSFSRNLPIRGITVCDVYSTDIDCEGSLTAKVASALINPVIQNYLIRDERVKGFYPRDFDWAVEIGFLAGVTDNVGSTVFEMFQDMSSQPISKSYGVYSAKIYFVAGIFAESEVRAFAAKLANPLINSIRILSKDDYIKKGGFEAILPKVKLSAKPVADRVNLQVSDEKLLEISQKGIPDPSGGNRGTLGLSLEYMKAIRDYFQNIEKRSPTDIELETLAQTWSEHCKHTIFASPIDEIRDGLYKHYIKRATEEIRKRKGNADFCVSVFKDNSGGIVFDENYLITDKVETHNSPSALDPFGGAITGIVGVNRDSLGFGLGAKPVANRYGFCFAYPNTNANYYRDNKKLNKILPPMSIIDGVIKGVEAGGNCSGIPTPQGFMYFDDSFIGKPLVFVGTIGLIPRKINGKPSHEKAAQNGDLIVMVGGRVGRDGIHGATFSSVALDEGSPSTAVQIGDPITQKKFSDVIIREARDMELYNSITDNGAGGLSSSVGEMARDSGGFEVDLAKVPLKYNGMAPWEIWISESQERMTLAVPESKVKDLISLMKRRGVEATIIGKFTSSGRAVVKYSDSVLMNMDMNFLHDGLPEKLLKTSKPHHRHEEPSIKEGDVTQEMLAILSRHNIAGKEFLSSQYDHEVQGNSALKPLQGRGRVFADATAIKPVHSSDKAVVMSQGLFPLYSDIDSYKMAAASIDLAVRASVAAGSDISHMAILDNFCWCDSTNPERLWQLKEAARACYEVAVAYGTPYISGKDSMFNDFKGYDESGKDVKISAPPTLLVSSLAVVDNVTQLISLDAKFAGDLIYLIGDSYDELGGSEYYAMRGVKGANVPTLNMSKALNSYIAYNRAVRNNLVSSAIALSHGGLWVAIAKMLVAGELGASIDLSPISFGTYYKTLFSESLGRILVTISPDKRLEFESEMTGIDMYYLGSVNSSKDIVIDNTIKLKLDDVNKAYKQTFADF